MVLWGILGALLGGAVGTYFVVRYNYDWKPFWEICARRGSAARGFLPGCIAGLELGGTLFSWLKVKLVAAAPEAESPPPEA